LTDRLVVSTITSGVDTTMDRATAGGHPSAHRRSVLELLDAHAAATPDAPAAAFPGGESTYAELAASSVRSARRLLAAGVQPGDRVGVLLREGSETYLSLGLGAMRLGAMLVAVNARNKVRELEYVIRHSGMRVLLTAPEFTELVERSGAGERCRVIVLGQDAAFEAEAGEEAVGELERGVGRDTPALLLYTSGTTANPKGCLLTHAALLAVGENCAERLDVTAADRFWTPLPLFHVGGWQAFMTMLARGGCFSHAGVFEATAALDQLERERVTMAFPAFELIWTAVLDHPRFPAADLSRLRIVQNVGVPERLQGMQARLPGAVQLSCFGMTETCGSICLGSPADSLHSRTHTSGRPMPGAELRVVGPDGAELGPGEPGELLCRGVSQFAGYFRDPEATAAAVDGDGWFRTGDVMCWEPDGSIRFLGRMKDMLKVGGENVSAAEIEGHLLTHPAVDVAAVVGASDGRYGEVPAAFVRLAEGATATEQELIAYCVGQIAGYKVPRYVRIVDDFPVTPTAKIQKFVLRERIDAELRERGITEAPRF
jgi:fatty-acyl-CoA synthase